MRNKYVLLILCLWISKINFSQSYYTRNYTTKDGLTENKVSCVYQDKRGFIWFVNDVLTCFDGNGFRKYPVDEDFTSTIIQITESRDGRLILLNDLKIYVQQDGICKAVKFPDSVGNGFYNCFVDHLNNLWIGTTSGKIIRCVIKNNRATLIKIFEAEPKYIVAFCEDIAGDRIFAGGTSTIYQIYNNKLTEVYKRPKNSLLLGGFKNLTYRNDKLFFVNNFEGEFDLKTSKLNVVPLPNNIFSGNLYIKSKEALLYGYSDSIFIKEGAKNTNFNKLLGFKLGGLSRQSIVDKNNNYWIGHGGGLLKIARYPIETVNIFSKDSLFGKVLFYENISKEEYFVLNKNLDLFHANHNQVTRLPFREQVKKIIGANKFHTIAKENLSFSHFKLINKSQLVIFINQNFIIFDIRLNKINELIKLKEYGASNTIYPIGDTAIIIKDLDKLILYNGKVSRIFHLDNSFKFMPVFGAKITKYNNIWLVTEHGLYILSEGLIKKIIVSQLDSNTNFTSMVNFNDTVLIVASASNGIFKIIDQGKSYKINSLITAKNIFQYNANYLFLDNEKKLWIANAKNICIASNLDGVPKIEYPAINDFYLENPMYQESNMNDVYNSYYCPYKNRIWNLCANPYGINLDSLNKNLVKDSLLPYFFSIRIKHYPLDDSLSERLFKDKYTAATFDYTQNDITIRFGIKNFIGLENLKMDYYLEGFDDMEWTHQNSSGLAEYTNLPAGNYTFHVKVNAIECPEKIFSFVILAPWYKSWWAMLLWGLMFCGAVFGFIRWQVMRHKKLLLTKNLFTEARLKALRAQINPHFIQNIFDVLAQNIYINKPDTSLNIIKTVSLYFRQMLYKSDVNTLSLEEELEYAEEYLKMKQTVYPNLFNYQIRLDDDIDTFGFKVPSMLLQPILENCCKHGFKDKKNYGGLISITLKNSGNYVCIFIEDNGVGITNEKIKEMGYKSYGMQLTLDRLMLIYPDKNNPPLAKLYNRKDGALGACFEIGLPKK